MVRILIIKTSSLGDIVHCLPVINDIKYFVPESSIDWLVEDMDKNSLVVRVAEGVMFLDKK